MQTIALDMSANKSTQLVDINSIVAGSQTQHDKTNIVTDNTTEAVDVKEVECKKGIYDVNVWGDLLFWVWEIGAHAESIFGVIKKLFEWVRIRQTRLILDRNRFLVKNYQILSSLTLEWIFRFPMDFPYQIFAI